MTDLFSPIQISRLHAEFAKIDRVDPCSPSYTTLIETMDAMSLPQLKQVRDAKIKFMGRLAANRIWNAERAA